MRILALTVLFMLSACADRSVQRLDHLARQCATGYSEASCMLFEVELQRQALELQRTALMVNTLQGMSAKYGRAPQPVYSDCGGWLVCP